MYITNGDTKITPCVYNNYWLKRLDINQNSKKVFKVVKQRNKKKIFQNVRDNIKNRLDAY